MRLGISVCTPARLLLAAINIGKFLMFHCVVVQNETREPR
jgi:hypothetical protein